MAWNEEQSAALQQIISAGEEQGLSTEEIQAQIDAKKAEFKAVKTSTTPASSGVDADLNEFSMASDLERGSLDSPDPEPDPKPKRIFKRAPVRGFSSTYYKNRELSDAEQDESRRVEKELLEINANVSEEAIEKARANEYFKLEDRPTKFVPAANMGSGSYQQIPIEEYLGEEKYEEYLGFIKNGEITAANDENEEYLNSLNAGSVSAAQETESKMYLRGVNQAIVNDLNFWGNKKEFKDEKEAINYLNKQKEFIIESNNSLSEKYDQYEETTKEFQIEFDGIDKQLKKIQAGFTEDFFGNMSAASPEDAVEYQNLRAEAQVLQDKFTEKGYNDLYKSLIKTQNDNNYLVDQYQEKAKLISGTKAAEKAASLNYRHAARVGMATEEFFIGGAVNFSSLTAQLGNRAMYALTKIGNEDVQLGKELDEGLDAIAQWTTNYNTQLADKREATIPDNITFDDIDGNDSIGYGTWFMESLANNSPSIITTFIPGATMLKGARGVSKAGKMSLVFNSKTRGKAMQEALRLQKTFGLVGRRTAQAIFMVGETGGKYGDIQVGEGNARQLLDRKNPNNLYAAREKETNPQILEDLDEQINDAELMSSYSFSQKAFTSYSYGVTATLAETFGSLNLITGAGRVAKTMGTQAFKKELYNVPLKFKTNTTKKVISGLTGGLTNAIGIETAEEALTQVAHNSLDILVLKENKSLLDGLNKEFFLQTAITSFAIMAPKVTGNTMNLLKNEFRIKASVDSNQKLVKELNELQARGNKMYAFGKKFSKKDNDRKAAILKELALNDAMTLDDLNSMTPQEIEEVADLNRQMRELSIESSNLGASGEIGPDTNDAKNRIKKQYTELFDRRNNLLGAKQRATDKKQKELFEANEQPSNNPDLQYQLGLENFYRNAVMTLMPKDGEFISVNSPAELAQELAKYSPETQKKIKEGFARGNYGANVGNDIILNNTAINQGMYLDAKLPGKGGKYAVTAALEELFHIQNKGKNILDKDGNLKEGPRLAVDQAIEQLKKKKELGKISEKDYNELINRFNDYKTGGRGKAVTKDGSRGAAEVDAEELMAQMNNAVALGLLDLSDFNAMTGLKNFINSLSKEAFGDSSWLFNLRTGEDVFAYIKNYNQNIQEKTSLALPAEEEKAVFGPQLKQKTEAIVKDSVGMAQDFDQYETNKDFKNIGDKKFTDDGIGVFNQIQDNSQFDSYLNQLINIDKNLSGLSSNIKSDIKQQIKEKIQERVLKNYKPVLDGQPRSVFSYIFGGAAQRGLGGIAQKALLDVKKDYAQTPSTVSTTTTEGKTIDVVDETQNVEETIDEADSVSSSRIKQEAPELIDQAIEDDIETAVLEIAEGVFPDVESKEFLPFIKEVIDGKLTNKFKDKFGTREQYNDFINKMVPALKSVMPVSYFKQIESDLKPTDRQFTEPPIRLTTQEDIDKARDNEQINYLENDAQGVNLYKLKKFSDKELANFFNPPPINPDTGKKSNTKGNRKTALATAVATQSAFDMIPSIFKNKVGDFELSKIGEKIRRDPRVKFSAGIQLSIQDLFKLSNNNPNFDLELAGINKLNTQLTDKGLNKTLDLKKLIRTPEGRKEIVDNYKWIMANLGPRDMWFGKQGKNKFTTSGSDYGVTGIDPEGRKALQTLRDEINALGKKDSGFKFGKPIDGVTDYSVSSYSTLLGNNKNANAKNKNGDIAKFNTKVRLIHEGMWNRIYNLIGDNKKNAPIIGSYLKLVANHTGHWHKLGAEIVGWSKNPKGIGKTLYEYEHAMPATAAYLYLMDVALNQTDFKSAYNAVMDNYKLIALDKAENAKLGKAGLGRGMPADWMLGDNYWWQRYFNKKMAGIEGGINPASIVFTNGRTFEDQLQIDSAGQLSTPALIKATQNAKNKINLPILKPTGIKFNKNDTNQNVLNEMGRLDKEQADAIVKNSVGMNLSKEFNEMIADKTGIAAQKVYGKAKAAVVGKGKGLFDLAGIPPSAQDFVGLLYYTLGKGKKGDAQMEFLKKNLLNPFARAMVNITNDRVALTNDFKALKKVLEITPKNLKTKIPGEPFTVEDAVRVYVWTQQGMTVPDLSQADLKELNDFIAKDEKLQNFGNQLIAINKGDGYVKPSNGWLAGTISTDLLEGLQTIKRGKYLEQWQSNVDEMFSEANLNKLEASFGKGYRVALENILKRMKTGSNRGADFDSLTGRFVDWLNGSVGAIMFFNTKSAVLQTISAVNFINWSDNNILKAAGAFANQPQYWKDVMALMNSDFLVERRNGLKINVNEADIAEIARESGNKAKAFIGKLLKLGFLPTQIADSFAIASGGATFFRNRTKTYVKEGMSQKDAETQAFEDFRETAEESQQSSRPDRISQQQAGPIGRVILAFANTPAQYARLIQKATSDILNGRGDTKTNISKIIYYGAIQNIIFNALQQALFALAFDDEAEDEKKQEKYISIANGMADSLLRGMGFFGAAISTIKNIALRLAQGAKAQDAALELLDISPPISSKIGKLRSAGRTWDWNQKEIREKGWSLDNPAWLASGQVVSATTNVPLDRVIKKMTNIKDASDSNNDEWKRTANALGWAKWELDWTKEKEKKKSKKRKSSRGRTSSRSRGRSNKRR